MEDKIEKTMLIGDIINLYPEKAEILLQAGMHCISCPAALMESLEEACEVHGIDVDELVAALNKEDDETSEESKEN